MFRYARTTIGIDLFIDKADIKAYRTKTWGRGPGKQETGQANARKFLGGLKSFFYLFLFFFICFNIWIK